MTYKAIVIGASTGGVLALKSVLNVLPYNFSLPIIIVQHLSPKYDSFLSCYLNDRCKIHIKEVDEKEHLQRGYGYISPPNYHLLVEKGEYLTLTVDKKVNYSRPSIDVLFETASDVYRDKLIGVILTGANSDGRNGMLYIKDRGGLTIVQDPVTAEAGEMPKSVIGCMDVDYILPLDEIGKKLIVLAGGE